MKSDEADEFIKFFEAMNKRFRGLYDFPVYVVDTGFWIISRSLQIRNDQGYVHLATSKKITKPGPIRGLRRTTDLMSFRIYSGSMKFFNGDGLSIDGLGPKRAEINIYMPETNWVASTQGLFQALGQFNDIRENIADPEIMEHLPWHLK